MHAGGPGYQPTIATEKGRPSRSILACAPPLNVAARSRYPMRGNSGGGTVPA